MNAETKRGVVKWLVREVIAGSVIVGLTLFIPAGTLNWPMGWALVGVYLVWTISTAILMIPRCPELLIERMARRKDAKTWDTVLMSIVGLTTLAKYIIAGLDFRRGWTSSVWQVPIALQIAALILAALGYALGVWAMTANAYFSKIIRIQDDRGQTVATGGPYRYVRHPGYTGTVVFELATPILLGSLWALIPGVLAAVLMVVRTALEDKTLQKELVGYQAYVKQTRYRLLPGVW
ncbi:MAG: isoprenylcysteine carboxylmethyltransferase family protein [Anaerolineae bacterium]|jgi:protein-S-isoprenylcysteine O-methyltransferase Ste14